MKSISLQYILEYTLDPVEQFGFVKRWYGHFSNENYFLLRDRWIDAPNQIFKDGSSRYWFKVSFVHKSNQPRRRIGPSVVMNRDRAIEYGYCLRNSKKRKYNKELGMIKVYNFKGD